MDGVSLDGTPGHQLRLAYAHSSFLPEDVYHNRHARDKYPVELQTSNGEFAVAPGNVNCGTNF